MSFIRRILEVVIGTILALVLLSSVVEAKVVPKLYCPVALINVPGTEEFQEVVIKAAIIACAPQCLYELWVVDDILNINCGEKTLYPIKVEEEIKT